MTPSSKDTKIRVSRTYEKIHIFQKIVAKTNVAKIII